MEIARDIFGKWRKPQPPTEEDVQKLATIVRNLTNDVATGGRIDWLLEHPLGPSDEILYDNIRTLIAHYDTFICDILAQVYYLLIIGRGQIPPGSEDWYWYDPEMLIFGV